MKINTIILGAGDSARFNMKKNKIFMKIQGKYILEYSLETFLKINDITNIIVIYNKNDEEDIKIIKNKYDNVKFVEGGKTRQESLKKGIKEIDINADKVIIHDAARPLIYLDILKDMIKSSKNKKALIPVRKAIEGVKIINDNKIAKSVDRDSIVFCQTPQIYDTDIILKLKENLNKGVISYLLDLNIEMDIYHLNKNLLKITTLDDFYYYDYLIRRNLYEKNKGL